MASVLTSNSLERRLMKSSREVALTDAETSHCFANPERSTIFEGTEQVQQRVIARWISRRHTPDALTERTAPFVRVDAATGPFARTADRRDPECERAMLLTRALLSSML